MDSYSTSDPSRYPPQEYYTLPQGAQYVADIQDIYDIREPLRVGEFSFFCRLSNSDGSETWIGGITAHTFSPDFQGSAIEPMSKEEMSKLKGKKAYEVNANMPLRNFYTNNRNEVAPTGRVVGRVVNAIGVSGRQWALVKMHDWFIKSIDPMLRLWSDAQKVLGLEIGVMKSIEGLENGVMNSIEGLEDGVMNSIERGSKRRYEDMS